MQLLLLLAICAANIICFALGAKIGQKIVRGEDVQLPSVNPLAAYREREEKQHAKAEQARVDAILRNIESYDGTGNGQEDVPGRS